MTKDTYLISWCLFYCIKGGEHHRPINNQTINTRGQIG